MRDPLQGGLVPLYGEEQKRRNSARYWIGLFILLVVSYAAKSIYNHEAHKKANAMGPKIVQAVFALSPEDLAHFASLRSKAIRICRKYLTVVEYDDFVRVCDKQSQGTMTQEEFDKQNSYYKKIKAHATKSEMDTLDQLGRLGQQLAGIKK
jgi:hypothetical protein